MTDANVRIVAANLHNFVNNQLMTDYIDQIPTIITTLKDVKLLRQTEAAFQDALQYLNKGILGLAALNALAKQLIEMILQTFDISYHQLIIPPAVGGLNGYINKFQMHLFDSSDANRPADKGAATYFTVMFILSYKDKAEADRRAQQLKDLFTAFEGKRAEILKAQLGYTTWDEVKEQFWGHYQKKYLAGSRAEQVPGGWLKYSVGDVVGISQVANKLAYALDNMSRIPDTAALNLSNRVAAVFDQIIGVLEDIVVVVDAYKKLLLDTQITVLLLPPITGSVSNIIPYIIPAYQNLGKYSSTLGDQIANKKYVDLAQGQENAGDYSTLVRSDFYTTGLNMVFKGPSGEAAIGEAKLFMALFGITIPDMPTISNAFEENVTPYNG